MNIKLVALFSAVLFIAGALVFYKGFPQTPSLIIGIVLMGGGAVWYGVTHMRAVNKSYDSITG